MLNVITLPNTTTLLTDVGLVSTPIFNDFWNLGAYFIGICLGFMILLAVVHIVIGAFEKYLMHGSKFD